MGIGLLYYVGDSPQIDNRVRIQGGKLVILFTYKRLALASLCLVVVVAGGLLLRRLNAPRQATEKQIVAEVTDNSSEAKTPTAKPQPKNPRHRSPLRTASNQPSTHGPRLDKKKRLLAPKKRPDEALPTITEERETELPQDKRPSSSVSLSTRNGSSRNEDSKTSGGRRMSRATGEREPSRTVNGGQVSAQGPITSGPDKVQLVGPVSQSEDLRNLRYIPPSVENEGVRRLRHPKLQNQGVTDPVQPVKSSVPAASMPTPTQNFGGITQAASGCGCLPPDTDGDVGPNHYIQSANSSIKIFDKTGGSLSGPTTYNSFFSALGPSTPCGNSQNDGDGIVFYDHMANRWVVSDFAFPHFPGTSFYQCIGVSKTADPVAGGWWLYAVQVDPSHPSFLGDYPKFGLWPDAYYFSVNLFTNDTTFNGVRVFALNRGAMLNGTGAPNAGGIAFTITPANLGDAYSLVPATFRTGSAPPAGRPEYFMAINSSSAAGTVETSVFAWRFHVDFVTPANSTFGVGANHTPNGTITVNGFVDAFTTTTLIVPQTGTTRLLDTLGDKLMTPLVYQNLNGTESLWGSHTVNNNQNGTGPTAIRWYQFNTAGNTIPATPVQQQTFNNGADGLWRWMPSIAVDTQGNMSIGYSASSSTTDPAIKYAGRLATDPLNSLAQGEALLIQGAGHQTSASGRWGDYSALSIDPADSCTFWHTNEYFSATSNSSWNTQIGSFEFPTCIPPPKIDAVTPPAGRVSGGQQIKLTGSFANLSSVMIGGVSASFIFSNGTIEVTVTTPPHAVGAVNIDLANTSGSASSKINAFAYLPTVFTDDSLMAQVTTAKAQHIIELRQAVDALRAVAGLGPAPWTDSSLVPSSTLIKAVHVMELRAFLENAASLLGYSAGTYTDPLLSSGFVIKRVHIEELRQRIRAIAG